MVTEYKISAECAEEFELERKAIIRARGGLEEIAEKDTKLIIVEATPNTIEYERIPVAPNSPYKTN
ncbi:MAG: hypothetical protein ACOCXG_00360 [Nanoarchaeota archaeon]